MAEGSEADRPVNPMIYLDNQATTQTDERVLEAMLPFFRDRFGNPHAVDHACGWAAARALSEATARIGALIGADSDEVILTSGATEANNLAISGIGLADNAQRRRRILVSAVEHKCVLGAARNLAGRHGFAVDLIPVGSEGIVDTQAFSSLVAPDVLLVSVMFVNNEVGSIQPIRELTERAHEMGALVHCDAAQAPLALDLRGLAGLVDLVSLSAHKIYGPPGIGALYVGRNLQDSIRPLFHGGGQQNGLRSGTLPLPLAVGFGVAASLCDGASAQTEREAVRSRRDRFVAGVKALGWPVHLNGPPLSSRHPGNANLRFDAIHARDLLTMLQPHVSASTGAACSSGVPEPSHVLAAMGLSRAAADQSVRFSLGRYTSDAEVDAAIDTIGKALSRIADVVTEPRALVGYTLSP